MLNARLNWPDLLDKLKAKFTLNETELAATIGLSRSMLSQVRIGHRPLPTRSKFVILDKLGYAMTRDLLLSALPSEVSETIAEADNARVQGKNDVASCANFLEEEFDRLDSAARRTFFSRLCELGDCDRKRLAVELEIRPADLKAIEAGTKRMPFWSRSAVLGKFEASEILSAIEQALKARMTDT